MSSDSGHRLVELARSRTRDNNNVSHDHFLRDLWPGPDARRFFLTLRPVLAAAVPAGFSSAGGCFGCGRSAQLLPT